LGWLLAVKRPVVPLESAKRVRVPPPVSDQRPALGSVPEWRRVTPILQWRAESTAATRATEFNRKLNSRKSLCRKNCFQI
jgi:hypothetical protein